MIKELVHSKVLKTLDKLEDKNFKTKALFSKFWVKHLCQETLVYRRSCFYKKALITYAQFSSDYKITEVRYLYKIS